MILKKAYRPFSKNVNLNLKAIEMKRSALSCYCLLFLLLSAGGNLFAQIRYEERNDGISKAKQLQISKLHELVVIDADSAEQEIWKLKKEIEGNNSSNINIEVLNLESELYRSTGDYVHMKLAYYQALSFKTEETSEYQKLLLQHIGAINEGVKGNAEKQKRMLLEVIRKASKKGFRFLKAKANFSLGKYYINGARYKQAMTYIEKAGKIFREAGYQVKYFEVNTSKGITSYWMEEYEKSLYYFHLTRSFTDKNNYTKCYANSLLNLAEAHLFIDGNQDSAKYYFNTFLGYKDKADVRDIFNCYWSLEEFYIQQKNNDSAYHYLKLAYQVDTQIKEARRTKINAEIDMLYRKLQDQRELQDEGKYQELLKIIFAFCGLFLILVILVFWFLLNEKGKLNKTLSDQNDEISLKNKIIDEALREKELLLKEIHHRVKNNLQIISSMLSLQTKNISDEKAKFAILEGKERIQAIALIHQKLYLDNSFATIEMDEYLGDLIRQLSNSYNEEAEKIKISLKTNRIVLNIDTVVPLGLIICELVTNAFKYAFTNKSGGTLRIEINYAENDAYVLNVKDNGVGMKENFMFLESQTLGVEIVTALTEQLDGEITYKSDESGTAIKIKFKETKN
ncbi:MAG: sensor histidine kinase [Bacteroidota bacterium]